MTPDLESPDPPLSGAQQAAIAELLALEDTALVGRLYARLSVTAEEKQEQIEHALDLERAYAANSQRTALADWRTWRRFCAELGVPALPATLGTLRRFL